MAEQDRPGDQQELSARLAAALPRLTPEQIARASPQFRSETYLPGQEIIRQDEPPQSFYIVVRGRAEVVHENPSGHRQIVDMCEPGSHFGEIGLLKDRPRTATVRASADGEVEVLVLEREAFLGLVKDSRATETQVTQDLIRHMINLAHYQD